MPAAICGIAAGLVLANPVAAWACGASADAYWALVGNVPADGGANVPLDAALAFEGRAFTTVFPDRSGYELASLLKVRVRERDSLAEVAGGVEGWALAPRPTAIWRPKESLRANTSYEVYARVDNRAAQPLDAPSTGRDLHSSFTTGADNGVPSTLSGPVTVERTSFEEPIFPCQGTCGNPPPCAPSHQVRRFRLRVTVPPLAGGFVDAGFRAWGFLVPGRPGDATHDAERDELIANDRRHLFLVTETNRAVSGHIHLPDGETRGQGCVYLVVEDVRGARIQAGPTCVVWAGPTPESQVQIPPSPGPETAGTEAPAGGCGVAGSTRSLVPNSGAGLAILALALSFLVRFAARANRVSGS